MTAALVAGASDTVASEIGKAWGTRTWALCRPASCGPARQEPCRWKGRPPGFSARRRSARWRSASDLCPAPRCCRLSSARRRAHSLESLLGATLEAPGFLNNDALNFINTALAAYVAISVAGALALNGVARCRPVRVLAAVHAGRPSTRLRVRSRDRGRRGAAGAVDARTIVYPLIGLLMAAVFNAASNALNQIYDLDIDRINKPKRPLPSGRLSIAEAWVFTVVTYAVALVLAWLVAPGRPSRVLLDRRSSRPSITFVYSAPPFRTKRLGIWANVTIAIPRGVLLKVAGLVGGEDRRRRRAVVHRRDLRSVPARRVDDQGFRGHGGRRARRLPHAADHLRRPPRGLDDLAVLRRALRDDLRRRLRRHPDRQPSC